MTFRFLSKGSALSYSVAAPLLGLFEVLVIVNQKKKKNNEGLCSVFSTDMILVYIFWSGGSKYMSDHNDRMVYTDTVHQAASAGLQRTFLLPYIIITYTPTQTHNPVCISFNRLRHGLHI